MIYRYEDFKNCGDLVSYMNKNSIDKDSIISVIKENGKYVLILYGEEPQKEDIKTTYSHMVQNFNERVEHRVGKYSIIRDNTGVWIRDNETGLEYSSKIGLSLIPDEDQKTVTHLLNQSDIRY